MAADQSSPTPVSVTTAAGPPTDADLLEWLDSLPCTYQRVAAGEQSRVTDRLILRYYDPGLAVPQNLTTTLQRHGYIFRQATPGVLVFQRGGGCGRLLGCGRESP